MNSSCMDGNLRTDARCTAHEQFVWKCPFERNHMNTCQMHSVILYLKKCEIVEKTDPLLGRIRIGQILNRIRYQRLDFIRLRAIG